jgi:hypothetical protein
MPEYWEVTPERIQQVENYASRGLKAQQIAEALGISGETFRVKRHEHNGLSAAFKRGKAKGIAHYADLLLNKAATGSVPAIIFFLKTKGGFVEKMQIRHTDDRTKREEYESTRKIAEKCRPKKK